MDHHKTVYEQESLHLLFMELCGNKSLKTLEFRGQRTRDIIPILSALLVNTTLEELFLFDLSVTDITLFYDVLRRNRTLLTLALHNNTHDLSPIARGLALNSTLTVLSLANNVADLEPLFQTLALSNSTLTLLNLSFNQKLVIDPLANMLRHNASLQELMLNYIPFNRRDIAVLAASLERNITLRILSVEGFKLKSIDPFIELLSTHNFTLTRLLVTFYPDSLEYLELERLVQRNVDAAAAKK